MKERKGETDRSTEAEGEIDGEKRDRNTQILREIVTEK
jgi:hypothetical protein